MLPGLLSMMPHRSHPLSPSKTRASQTAGRRVRPSRCASRLTSGAAAGGSSVEPRRSIGRYSVRWLAAACASIVLPMLLRQPRQHGGQPFAAHPGRTRPLCDRVQAARRSHAGPAITSSEKSDVIMTQNVFPGWSRVMSDSVLPEVRKIRRCCFPAGSPLLTFLLVEGLSLRCASLRPAFVDPTKDSVRRSNQGQRKKGCCRADFLSFSCGSTARTTPPIASARLRPASSSSSLPRTD